MTHSSDSADPERPPRKWSDSTYPITAAEMQHMLDETTASIDRERGLRAWLRALPTGWRVVTAGLVVLASVATVSSLVPRGVDFQFYPAPRLWGSIGLYAVLLAVLVATALRPLHRVELRRRVVLALGMVAFAAPYGLALWPRAAQFASPKAPNDCFPIGIATGVALIALLRTLGRSEGNEPRLVLLVAAAAGIAANLTLIFHCADQHPLHLVLVHAPLGLTLFWGYRWTALRLARRAPDLSVPP